MRASSDGPVVETHSVYGEYTPLQGLILRLGPAIRFLIEEMRAIPGVED